MQCVISCLRWPVLKGQNPFQSITLLILAQKRSLKNMIKKVGRGTEERNQSESKETEWHSLRLHSRSLKNTALHLRRAGGWAGLLRSSHCSMDRICLEVVSSFKCFVVYLRALRRPSTLLGGWSLRTLIQPFISILEVLANAPTGWTWS